MTFSPTRRRILQATPAVAVAPFVAACGSGEELPLPPELPIGPFGKNSTAEDVTEAWTYAGGRCVNVDGGIYLGGPGFVHQLN